MIGPLYYRRDGTPIDDGDGVAGLSGESMAEFVSVMEQDRRVALSYVEDESAPGLLFRVSTVFLGIDHSHGMGVPLLFETMTFAKGLTEKGPMDDEIQQRRYPTEREALLGHRETVARIAADMKSPKVTDVEGDEASTASRDT